MGRRRAWWVVGAALFAAAGCAHSEDEWQAQLHTASDLRVKLDAEQAEAKKARADLDESTAKIEQLKQQLRTAGVDVANLNANLETQARASEDYRRHGEQLEATKRRFELLRAKLLPLGKQGLAVTIRNNRVVILLPGDALFDAGRETLRREGREMLLAVASLLRSDPGLSARAYQVAGHVDGDARRAAGSRIGFGLSVMRAREVVALLLQPADKGGGGGPNPSGWSAAGYGDADPLKPNDTPGGQAGESALRDRRPARRRGSARPQGAGPVATPSASPSSRSDSSSTHRAGRRRCGRSSPSWRPALLDTDGFRPHIVPALSPWRPRSVHGRAYRARSSTLENGRASAHLFDTVERSN